MGFAYGRRAERSRGDRPGSAARTGNRCACPCIGGCACRDGFCEKINNFLTHFMQFLIETDVLREYLVSAQPGESILRTALATEVCYTTMVNALELFRASRTNEEHDAVM